MNAILRPPSNRSAPSARLAVALQGTARIGDCTVDFGALRIVAEGRVARLAPKAMRVLAVLAETPGATVARDVLLDRVWPEEFPTPDVLGHAVKDLRRAFGDDPRQPRYLETVPRVGYRLIAPVQAVAGSAPSGTPAAIADTADVPAAAPAAVIATAGPDALRGARRRRGPVAAVLGAVLVIALVALLAVRDPRPVSPAVAAAAALRTVSSSLGPELFPQLSPDGGLLAYAAFEDAPASRQRLRVYVRSVDAGEPRRLTTSDDGGELQPRWSPDGGRIALLRLDGSCRVVVIPALGGEEADAGPCDRDPMSFVAWSADGDSLLLSRRPAPGQLPRLVRRPLATLRDIPLATGAVPGISEVEPQPSPDGRWIAFRRHPPTSDLWLIPAAGGEARRLTALGSIGIGFDWLGDGSGLVFTSTHGGTSALYVVDLADLGVHRLAVGGQARAPDVALHSPRVVFEQLREQRRLLDVPLGPPSPDAVPRRSRAPSTGSDSQPAWSPRGEAFAFVSTRSGRPQVWLADRDPARAPRQLTTLSDGVPALPAWSPDGGRLLHLVHREDRTAIHELDLSAGAERELRPPRERVFAATYGRDGRSVFLSAWIDERWQLVERDLATGDERVRVPRDALRPMDGGDGGIYFVDPVAARMKRLDPVSGEVREITVLRDALLAHRGFDVRGGFVWYVDGGERLQWHVARAPIGGGPVEWMGDLGTLMPDYSLSVSPDLSRALVARIETDDTDLGVGELARVPAGGVDGGAAAP